MGAWSVFVPCHLHTKRIRGRSNQVSDCLRCLPRFAMLVQSAMKHQVRSTCWVPEFALIILPALHGTLSWPWSYYYGRLHHLHARWQDGQGIQQMLSGEQLPISPDSPWLESLPVSAKHEWCCVLAWDYQRLKLQWLMPWTTMCCKERTEELRRHESVTRLCATVVCHEAAREPARRIGSLRFCLTHTRKQASHCTATPARRHKRMTQQLSTTSSLSAPHRRRGCSNDGIWVDDTPTTVDWSPERRKTAAAM